MNAPSEFAVADAYAVTMNCPSDGTTLLMSERQGVEIDYCPQCRGVWLDRGELDKILERAQAESQSFAPAPPTQTRSSAQIGYATQDRESDRRSYDDRGNGYADQRRRRKKSPFDFLGEIFE